jgi:hypothetical protein
MANQLQLMEEARLQRMRTPKGETIPQTVACLQEVMAEDAIGMLRMHNEIASLKSRVNNLQQQLKACRGKKIRF